MTGTRRTRRALTLAAGALALSVLTGCSVHPGDAAVVGDATLTTSEVDAAALALCAANSTGEGAPALASRGARQAAVQFLIDAELSRQFGQDKGFSATPSDVSDSVDQNKAAIAALPEADRETFTDLLVGFQTSALILAQAGAASLADQGQADPSPEEATAEGTRLRGEWASDVDVEVDPRFGSYVNGALAPISGSLSVPVSTDAKAGAQTDPGADWVAALPASQKCS